MRFLGLLLTALVCLAQRPIQHSDYASWNSIVSPRLSDNGRFLIYGLFPQDGDGVAVIRDLNTEAEIRQPAGKKPDPPEPDFSLEGPPPPPPGLTSAFTKDGTFAVFQTYASKGALETARKEKKKPDETPRGDVVVVRLATGEIFRANDVKSFKLADEASNRLAYLKRSGDLIVRSLGEDKERVFPDASEYELSGDGKTLVYLAKKGAYAVSLPDGSATALSEGEGKYGKLVRDEGSSRFAFVRDGKLILWRINDNQAATVAENASPNGALNFSSDGSRLFFGLPIVKPAPETSSDAVFDLWHYQDDFIQPMQRVRAKAERERSDRAVYLVDERKVVPLSNGVLTRVTPSRDGRVGVGLDDAPYRKTREYDAAYSDFYVVDVASGKRIPVQKKMDASPTLSPDGRYAIAFTGGSWVCWDTATGERRDLTGITGRAFYREDFDSPRSAPAYGSVLWTRDSRFVLIPDRYDVWQFSPDGSLARNLTGGAGRKRNLELRVVNLNSDSKAPGLDPSAPFLLRAEDQRTRETGFYRHRLDTAEEPEKLVMQAANLGTPVKAKDADVLLLSLSKFDTFPDLQVTNSNMAAFRKVSNANPQKSDVLWGSNELISYRNTDGKELSAVLFKPAGFDPAKKYPMIIYLYERLSDTTHNFVAPAPSHRINASYYTSNGYVVLMPDIVYTIGYPGASALKCIVPATQKVIEMGFVDPDRVGIQGHSWGGYQIAYMITQTNLFKAAAPGALVANMVSAYDGIRWGPGLPRQFQYEKTQSRIGGTPWQYPLRFIENSPIFMADRVQTPVLMLHNDADDAVPWYQGIEFFLALRRLEKEVYFFNYNGEPHGLRKRANQMDYTIRMQQFFDHYLKGEPKPSWMLRGRPFVEKKAPAEMPGAPTDEAPDTP